MLICPVPSFSILLQTASMSCSSSSSWALFSNLLGSFALSSALTLSLSRWISISRLASSNASMSSYMVTGLTGSLTYASLSDTSGTNMGSSSKKKSSTSSITGSAGGSLLSLVESDCILRILQAISRSFPATIMSKLSEDTFA